MEETNTILNWLFQQGPLAVFSGVAIWWLVKRYESSENKKDDLAGKVVQFTVLWAERLENENNNNNNKDAEIKALLIEIRDLCKHGK